MLKQVIGNIKNIFSPEEEAATDVTGLMHVCILVSKDTRTAKEEACFFFESSLINPLDFCLFGMILIQNNRLNQLFRIPVYMYNY